MLLPFTVAMYSAFYHANDDIMVSNHTEGMDIYVWASMMFVLSLGTLQWVNSLSKVFHKMPTHKIHKPETGRPQPQ